MFVHAGNYSYDDLIALAEKVKLQESCEHKDVIAEGNMIGTSWCCAVCGIFLGDDMP